MNESPGSMFPRVLGILYLESERVSMVLLRCFKSISSVVTCLCLALTFASCTKAPPVAKIVILKPEAVKQLKKEPELTQLERWKRLVRENRNASIEKKLVTVNEFFNRLDYVEDKFLWGMDDFWATLPETLNRNGGDCEDVSIAKYFTLRHMNIPEENLRITYVMSLKTDKPHMVLTYSPDFSQEPIVLDTMNNYLFTVSKRPDLIPVYSFNANGFWLAEKQKSWYGKRIGGAERLSLWQGVLHRMKGTEEILLGG